MNDSLSQYSEKNEMWNGVCSEVWLEMWSVNWSDVCSEMWGENIK